MSTMECAALENQVTAMAFGLAMRVLAARFFVLLLSLLLFQAAPGGAAERVRI